MDLHDILIKQLDQNLELWKAANAKAPMPKEGWVRTIRKAFGMTILQLARRLDVNPSRIVAIEMAEPKGSINVKSLQEVANALECKLVYALVPKNSLKTILDEKSNKLIKNRLQRVSHSMSLENQALSNDFEQEQLETLLRSHLAKPRFLNSLWDEPVAKVSRLKNKRMRNPQKPKGKPDKAI